MADNAYVSQIVSEVLLSGHAKARVSQNVQEVLLSGVAQAKISQVVIEVLLQNITTSYYEVSVTNVCDVGQTIRPNLVKTLLVTSAANINQEIVLGGVLTVNVTSHFNASQTIAINRESRVYCTNNLTATQLAFVNSPRVLSVSNQALLDQTITAVDATFHVAVTNIGTLYQIIRGHNAIFKVSVSNTFTVSDLFIPRDLIISVNITHTLNVLSRITSEYRLIVTSTASINQFFGHLRVTTQYLTDTQVLTDDFLPTRISTHQLTDILILTDDYVRSGEYLRLFQDVQVLTDTYRQAILITDGGFSYDPYPVSEGQPPIVPNPHPVVTGTPVLSSQQTVIESFQGQIILPAAEYGDTFGGKLQNTIKKTMTGKIYTYLRTSKSDKFTLTWVLGIAKAYELAAFFDANIRNNVNTYYTLYLWNGEIWQANLTSTDIPLTYEGRWQNIQNNNSELERLNVVIEWEGTRLL